MRGLQLCVDLEQLCVGGRKICLCSCGQPHMLTVTAVLVTRRGQVDMLLRCNGLSPAEASATLGQP